MTWPWDIPELTPKELADKLEQQHRETMPEGIRDGDLHGTWSIKLEAAERIRTLMQINEELAAQIERLADSWKREEDDWISERERLRGALEMISKVSIPERNPDGDDQAAETMQLIASDALSG